MKNTSLSCAYCGTTFERQSKNMHVSRRAINVFCGAWCQQKHRTFVNTSIQNCKTCGTIVRRQNTQAKKSKSGFIFCSKSCSATYRNKNAKKSRRSKCEIKLFNLLQEEFPDLIMIANDKTMLSGMEVDIAIPSLMMAIEWNGIVHFKPIYGEEKLASIRQKDADKKILANTYSINLIVVTDLVSTEKLIQEAFLKISAIIYNMLMLHPNLLVKTRPLQTGPIGQKLTVGVEGFEVRDSNP